MELYGVVKCTSSESHVALGRALFLFTLFHLPLPWVLKKHFP